MNTTIPRVFERQCGGYLAVSKEGSRFKIGVEADTEEEALQRFDESLKRWERLFEEEESNQRYDA